MTACMIVVGGGGTGRVRSGQGGGGREVERQSGS
jgi:hypothetical protein